MARLFFFASLQDLMGVSQQEMQLPPHWCLADLLAYLEEQQPALKPLRGHYRVALDRQMASDHHQSLAGISEVALIPPVSGGRGPWVRLSSAKIEVAEVIEAVSRKDCGAVLLFLGTVRDHFEEQPVQRIDYSAYEAMAAQELHRLAQQALDQIPRGAVAVCHRLGAVLAGEASLAIAVASPHRAAAFQQGQWLLEAIKAQVPIWKKEVGPGGQVWIEGDSRVGSLQP